MRRLELIGIGTGNPKHLTQEAIEAIQRADLVLLPHKESKPELAEVRMALLKHCGAQDVAIAHFDMPVRRQHGSDYDQQVDEWHDEIANRWEHCMSCLPPDSGRVALLVWGDPALYDSSLRIARRLQLPPEHVRVLPGITSMQVLCSAHKLTFNDIGAPFLVTTGRRLREAGWPEGIHTLIVMLDGSCAFECIPDMNVSIYWGAYLGMPQQLLLSGPLQQLKAPIREAREQARSRHGWVMDIYLLRRSV